jgi:hypothetical protein
VRTRSRTYTRIIPALILCISLRICSFIDAELAYGQSCVSNPIIIENQRRGSLLWKPGLNGLRLSDETTGIQGYASATSVNKGQNITFYVNSFSTNVTFTIDIYRMGYYGGTGGRLLQHIGPLPGANQPPCSVAPLPPIGTGLIECHWSPTYALSTSTNWASGIYLAHLIVSSTYESYIIFVLRDDSRKATFLYQQPVTTYQAYNNWGGASYYDSGETDANGNTIPAVKVSFDRPYAGDGWGEYDSLPSIPFYESHFVRWLEMMGYDVTYSTNLDTHTNGAALLNYQAFLDGGHDEYWSMEMYNAMQAARDAGVNLAFLCANNGYWQIRMENSSSGTPNRVQVCYKDAQTDPVTDPALKTIQWRDLGRPEQQLDGIQFGQNNDWPDNANFVVTNSSNWVFNGSSLVNGSSIPKIVGQEVDHEDSSVLIPANLTYSILSRSPFLDHYGATQDSNSSIYQAPSGAYVFSTGTHSWSWALENWTAPNGYSYAANSGIQRATKNVLDQMLIKQTPPIYNIYALDTSGSLHYFKDAGRNGASSWGANSGNVIATGWNFLQITSGGKGVIYALDANGNLYFYKDLARNGTQNWDPASGSIIATGWNYVQVAGGGNGVIYALDSGGHLHFYQDLAQNGAVNWAPNSGAVIATGWNYPQMFAGGNGVIYTVDSAGNLRFYQDLAQDGTVNWAPNSGAIIGTGIQYTQIFSGGNGIVYGVDSVNGILSFLKDLGQDGTVHYAYPMAITISNTWTFPVSTGDL